MTDSANRYITNISSVELGIPDVPALDDMRTVAVLAFDAGWFAQGLACIATLRRRAPASLHVAVLGMGLSARERRTLQEIGVEHREMPKDVPASKDAPGHARAMTCRPLLRELFPGHDVYFWVDSDIRFLR